MGVVRDECSASRDIRGVCLDLQGAEMSELAAELKRNTDASGLVYFFVRGQSAQDGPFCGLDCCYPSVAGFEASMELWADTENLWLTYEILEPLTAHRMMKEFSQ